MMAEPLDPWGPVQAEAQEPYVECPTDGSGQGYAVVYPRPGERLTVQALGTKVRGVMTHFVYPRTELCVARWAPCPGCQRGQARRWEGYLAVRDFATLARRVLKVTQAGYRNCKGLLALDGKLRGHILEALRPGKTANWPVRYVVKTLAFDADLPLAHDIGPTLCFMWGVALDSVIGRALVEGARAELPKAEGNGHA